MSQIYLDTTVVDNFPGFPTTKSGTDETVASDGKNYKAVVTGPGTFKVLIAGAVVKSQVVPAARVDILLDDITPFNAPEGAGIGVEFVVSPPEGNSEQKEEVLRYRFVRGEDFFTFEDAYRSRQENLRLKQEAERGGANSLRVAASRALSVTSGDASENIKGFINSVGALPYIRLASVLSGNGEYAVTEAMAAFDVLFEKAAKGILFTLPNETWFHRVVVAAASRQSEPLPLRRESVEAFVQELRDSPAGQILAAKTKEFGGKPFTGRELVLLVRAGAIVQDPPHADGRLGRIRVNRAFMAAGHEESLNYFLRLTPYDK
ncbi:MAG TPA: hypothetical protein V6C81_13255 [Planktothrix sp.]|jgi:hypothetical protein